MPSISDEKAIERLEMFHTMMTDDVVDIRKSNENEVKVFIFVSTWIYWIL
jgi:hypothetical protein